MKSNEDSLEYCINAELQNKTSKLETSLGIKMMLTQRGRFLALEATRPWLVLRGKAHFTTVNGGKAHFGGKARLASRGRRGGGPGGGGSATICGSHLVMLTGWSTGGVLWNPLLKFWCCCCSSEHTLTFPGGFEFCVLLLELISELVSVKVQVWFPAGNLLASRVSQLDSTTVVLLTYRPGWGTRLFPTWELFPFWSCCFCTLDTVLFFV